MFDFFKKNKPSEQQDKAKVIEPTETQEAIPIPESKTGLLSKLKNKLVKTKQQFSRKITDLFSRYTKIDETLYQELEQILLTSDVGIHTTEVLIKQLKLSAKQAKVSEVEALKQLLTELLFQQLQGCNQPLKLPEQDKPFVLLMVGVNGAGKTTTIGKLTQQFQAQGKKVMLAAGDTFRAAAINQLKTWGERHNVPVIHQEPGADSASVIYDAIQAATARHFDVIIADTAGRLHTQGHLMEELKKVVRVIKKIDQEAPHETMLIIDGTTGQNALTQAEKFHQAIQLSGVCVTKLDGTAKGGSLFAIAERLKLPIRFIGVGEKADDLKQFDAKTFISALFDTQEMKEQDVTSTKSE